MRGAMPSPASVVYLLGSVAKEKTEGTYARRLPYFGEWKIRKNGKEISTSQISLLLGEPKQEGKDEENLTLFFRHYQHKPTDHPTNVAKEILPALFSAVQIHIFRLFLPIRRLFAGEKPSFAAAKRNPFLPTDTQHRIHSTDFMDEKTANFLLPTIKKRPYNSHEKP